MRGVCHFSTKLVSVATSLEIPEKEVQIDHLRPWLLQSTFYRLRRLLQTYKHHSTSSVSVQSCNFTQPFSPTRRWKFLSKCSNRVRVRFMVMWHAERLAEDADPTRGDARAWWRMNEASQVRGVLWGLVVPVLWVRLHRYKIFRQQYNVRRMYGCCKQYTVRITLPMFTIILVVVFLTTNYGCIWSVSFQPALLLVMQASSLT